MDVLVIGGGIAGAMTAHYLSSAGFSVALADREMRNAVSTSMYNAGSLDENPSFTEVRPVSAAVASLLGRYAPVSASLGNIVKDAGWIVRALNVKRKIRNPLEERLLRLSLALWDDLVKEDSELEYYSKRGLRLYGDLARAEAESKYLKGRLLNAREVEDLGFVGFQGGVEHESRWINPHHVMRRMRDKHLEDGDEIRPEDVLCGAGLGYCLSAASRSSPGMRRV
ncbi:FAD-dependent oxidoreductase [Thermogutta sp.]|uniref:FAD-dependent oxidoreductase n=1 Tax=Thermogutta sp. TaxID=1962930 RepID=UPI00321FC35F